LLTVYTVLYQTAEVLSGNYIGISAVRSKPLQGEL